MQKGESAQILLNGKGDTIPFLVITCSLRSQNLLGCILLSHCQNKLIVEGWCCPGYIEHIDGCAEV